MIDPTNPASGQLWFFPAALWFLWFAGLVGRDFVRAIRSGRLSRADVAVSVAWLLLPAAFSALGHYLP